MIFDNKVFRDLQKKSPVTVDHLATSRNEKPPLYFFPVVDPLSQRECSATLLGSSTGLHHG